METKGTNKMPIFYHSAVMMLRASGFQVFNNKRRDSIIARKNNVEYYFSPHGSYFRKDIIENAIKAQWG